MQGARDRWLGGCAARGALRTIAASTVEIDVEVPHRLARVALEVPAVALAAVLAALGAVLAALGRAALLALALLALRISSASAFDRACYPRPTLPRVSNW